MKDRQVGRGLRLRLLLGLLLLLLLMLWFALLLFLLLLLLLMLFPAAAALLREPHAGDKASRLPPRGGFVRHWERVVFFMKAQSSPLLVCHEATGQPIEGGSRKGVGAGRDDGGAEGDVRVRTSTGNAIHDRQSSQKTGASENKLLGGAASTRHTTSEKNWRPPSEAAADGGHGSAPHPKTTCPNQQKNTNSPLRSSGTKNIHTHTKKTYVSIRHARNCLASGRHWVVRLALAFMQRR